MASTQTLTLIATVLADAENFLAGKPVTVEIPAESFVVEGITFAIPATALTVTK